MGIKPQPGVMDIALYKGGKSHVDGIENVLKLSSNENPFGPSEAAKEALLRASHDLHRYPSTDHAGLRAAIGDVWGLDPERIICGAGSGEVLDVDILLGACTDNTKLVYIANPANPTGTMISEADLERLADGIPKGAVLVLDGAYAEYVEGYDAGKNLVDTRDNVIMTRTFSKIYGLGGLRIGYGYAPQEIIDVLMRLRGPFNLSAPALAAAEAAMRDEAHTEKCRDENTRMRDWMAGALAEMGLPSDTSTANFILPRFASEQEAVDVVHAIAQFKGITT